MSTQNDQLRQRLLEMIQGLLSDVETAELREKICSDPEIARAYSEVSIEADGVAKAARRAEPELELPNECVRLGGSTRYYSFSLNPNLGRAAVWVVYLALSLLVTVTLGGYLWDRSQRRDLAKDHMRLLVSGPATITPGVESRVTVRTESITGEPLPASIELSLVSLTADGKGRKQERQLLNSSDRVRHSDASGQPTEFIIPANLAAAGLHGLETHATSDGLEAQATPSVRLDVLAHSGPSNPRFSREILIEPERLITQVSLDKPWYQPGETVYFRSLTLASLSLSTQREIPLEFEILDPAGSPVAGSKSQGVTEHGVGNGLFALDAGLAEGDYTLVVRSLDTPAAFAERKKAFRVRKSSQPSAKPNPINLDKLTVDFYPEGGDLVEGLSNRVYFAALDPAGEPVHVEGDIVDSAGRAVATVTTVKDGRGSFTFTPIKGQNYQLKFRKPESVTSIATLPSVNPLRTVVLSTGGGVFGSVFDAGAPLTLDITAKQARLPLVVSATCRGTSVGQTTLITGEAGVLNVVTLPLAAAAEGVIRVTVYDYSGPKPEPIAERLVFRRGTRKLNVALDSIHHAPRDASPRAEREGYYKFRPGQKAELKLKVTDEQGRPVAAILGVAVVDDTLLTRAKDHAQHQPATMPTEFRLASQIEKPEQLEDVNFYLSDNPKAAEGLDLLLGTQGWRRLASQREPMPIASGPGAPPVVYDNFDEIRGPYGRDNAEYEIAHRTRQRAFSGLAFYGGIAMLLGIAALGLLQLLRAPRVWVPAMAVATACLILGGLWRVEVQREARQKEVCTVAASVFRADDTRQISTRGVVATEALDQQFDKMRFPIRQFAYRHPVGQIAGQADIPEVLFWHPMVVANANGEAIIRFDAPDTRSKFPDSKFRVVADAHCEEITGDGRITTARIGTGGGMIEVTRE